MAFTDAQKADLRSYMGYPDVFRYANTRLENAFDVIGARAEVQAKVVAWMAVIVAVDALIQAPGGGGGAGGASGSIKRVDEIEFYPLTSASGSSSMVSWSSLPPLAQGKIACARISRLFGVPLEGDYFGTTGYSDDEWSRREQQFGVFPLL